MLKSVYAIPHASPRFRVPESAEQGQDGGREYGEEDSDVRPYSLLSADSGVNESLQWENLANSVNVTIFGNPYVFIHSGRPTRVQKLSEKLSIKPVSSNRGHLFMITTQSGRRNALKQFETSTRQYFPLYQPQTSARALRPHCRGRGVGCCAANGPCFSFK